MKHDSKSRLSRRQILLGSLAALVLLLAVLIVPPLVSINHYKGRVTHLLSASLGRPVHLSSVEARLLPRPGFILTDLTVDEDPAYGVEPVLHATEVKASIRLFALWRGKLELDAISVDEASVNVVRTGDGHWNVDPLLRSAANSASAAASGKKPLKLPYLEATHTRVNIKNGAEKLPFSLMDANLDFWQSSADEWRVRMKGRPARTDVSMNEGDTGKLRLEARLHRAPEMRKMPVEVNVEWKEAQLGQLSRLVLGSDAGWRGDLTGNAKIEGTAESATVKARLSAEHVHRAEFAPTEAMDFDANCAMTAHFAARAVENLKCDSPLGGGRVHVEGNLLGAAGQPHITVAMDKVPVSAGLDALRTIRSDFAPGLEAHGALSGQLVYAPAAPVVTPEPDAKKAKSAKKLPAPPQPLTGQLAIDGLLLKGGGLSDPLNIGSVSIQPATVAADEHMALATTVQIPAGAPSPLTVAARFARTGYQVALHGQATVNRGRELARMVGFDGAELFTGVASPEPVSLELTANGPWTGDAKGASDHIEGTATLRNANWRADYLNNHLEIAQATLHFTEKELRWDPVTFNYGPIKGVATVTLPATNCQNSVPELSLQFGALNSELLQAAFLGAEKKDTVLSTLLERLHPTASPAWPQVEATVKADALTVGPTTFKGLTAALHIGGNHISASTIDAALLGGTLHATGEFEAAANSRQRPAYKFEASFHKLQPTAVAQLVSIKGTGTSFDGSGHLELSGYTTPELAASAKGSMHFAWTKGTLAAAPASLAHFDQWSGDAAIESGKLTVGQNAITGSKSAAPVSATVGLGESHKLDFGGSAATSQKR